jgi:excinuclease UvrABC nuclease subunit
MDDPVQYLIDLGFEEVGSWVLNNELLKCQLAKHSSECGVLYAFVSEAEVLYVGKSVRTLKTRLYGYERPGPSQRTNIAGNEKLRQLLTAVPSVTILALVVSEPVLYRGVPLNVAAGLEDPLIARLKPKWNRIGV